MYTNHKNPFRRRIEKMTTGDIIDGEEEKHENCAKRGEPHNLQGGELSEDVGRSTQ